MRLGQVTPGLVAGRHATCTEVEALRHEGQGVVVAGQEVKAAFWRVFCYDAIWLRISLGKGRYITTK